MATRIEIGFGAVALVCFAGAADAWLGTGAFDRLVDLCLGNSDVSPSNFDSGSVATRGHETHVSLFLAAGLAFLGIGLTSGEHTALLRQRRAGRLQGMSQRRLIAALVFVARSCKGATQADVAEAYQAATGEAPERSEIGKAVGYLRSARAASIEQILGRLEDDDEKRSILNASCRIWVRHGVDSETATRAIERVAKALGLEGNEINSAMDAPWTIDPAQFFKDVETVARRTVSRATTGAQRITTRIRRLG